MPFISKDWRSPGEEWVKTEEGWEKKKILECGKRLSFSQESLEESFSLQDEEGKDNVQVVVMSDSRKNVDGAVQPHCRVIIKCTKEFQGLVINFLFTIVACRSYHKQCLQATKIAGFNGLSDALKRLDFRSAVHDARRFHYICKLLDLLISQKLAALSGHAQKVLFNMLEEVAYQVSASQQNIHLLHKLLRQLTAIVDCACWGRPLGSTQLWESHLATINRILTIANTIQIREPADELYPKLQNLPEECVREVMLRLDDHKDLQASGKAYSMMARLCGEQRIWRELCQFHFTQQQIIFTTDQMQHPYDWQQVFHKLRKSFGLREEYAEMIQLCRNCRCLFWKSIGHPCIADTDPDYQEKLEDVDKNSLYVPIPPQAFLKFFSL